MSVPERIGRLQIRECIGTGGFATVWRAHDAELDADVAVKILAENWVPRVDVRARFVEEARLLRRADSDRVVRVHDIGTLDDGRPYFVMTLADGGTLAERLAGGPPPVPDALDLIEECAQCIAVLHDIGVLHRDVKPSNLLFRSTAAGRERLMIGDLGLAKALAFASGFTVAAGSPGYMPPEQVTPGGDLDARADVYALGAVAYQLLTGKLPTRDRRPQPSRLRPGIGPEVDAVVMRALALDRELRHRDAAEFCSAVAAASAPPQVPPPPSPTPRPGPEPVPRPVPPPVQAPFSPAPGTQPPSGPPGQWAPRHQAPRQHDIAPSPAYPHPSGQDGGRPASRPPGIIRAATVVTLVGAVVLFLTGSMLLVALPASILDSTAGEKLVGQLSTSTVYVICAAVLAGLGIAMIFLAVHAGRGRGGARIGLTVLGALGIAFDVFAVVRGVPSLGAAAVYTAGMVLLYWVGPAHRWFRRPS